ncbi:MAG: sel1 repeat family protein [Duodenibacillus sp.]|nr:sel1 repeat family protein [Duodenibacillus sp.]
MGFSGWIDRLKSCFGEAPGAGACGFSELAACAAARQEAGPVRREGEELLAQGDRAGAARRFRQAAALGDADALVRLGDCLRNGVGVALDPAAAAACYERAARKGSERALLALARCYIEGRGVEPDQRHAFALHRQAAELGSAEGMCLTGQDYQLGLGVERDEAQARRWLERAAALGHGRAARLLG